MLRYQVFHDYLGRERPIAAVSDLPEAHKYAQARQMESAEAGQEVPYEESLRAFELDGVVACGVVL